MTRDEPVAPTADKIEELSKDKSTISTKDRHVLINAGPAATPNAWLKPLGDYERRQRREYQVARFG